MRLEPMINNRMLKFCEQFDLTNLPLNEQFEKFVNFLMFKSHDPSIFTVKDDLLELCSVGGGHDLGLDGIGVKINDYFIKSIEEVDEFISQKKKLNIDFVFIQSKNKSGFSSNEFLTFSDGVKDMMFGHNIDKIANSKVLYWKEIRDYIYSDKVMTYWIDKPKLSLYFVTTSSETQLSPDILSRKEKLITEIDKNGDCYINDIWFFDINKIYDIIKSQENNFSITIGTEGSISLPEVSNITNSAIIYTTSDELLKLLRTPEGLIRKNLFFDNVRAYQGENEINSEIFKTIVYNPSKFILLNNGITIVCESFVEANRKVTINNPQIVNGCQTCNVIFEAYRKSGLETLKVPVSIKLIASEDEDTINEIVRSTNRQNIVLEEVFEITRSFHKKFEDYCYSKSIKGIDKLYYERRSKQFLDDDSIKVSQKINLRILTQSSVNFILERPEISHKHENSLLKQNKDKIFLDYHSFEPYFSSILSNYIFENLFYTKKINKKYFTYKFHLILIAKYMLCGEMPSLNDTKKIDIYCNSFNNKIVELKDNDSLINNILQVFNNSINIYTNSLHKSIYGVKQDSDFIKILREQSKISNSHVIASLAGHILNINKDKNNQTYGFIKSNNENYIFFQSQNVGIDFYSLKNDFVVFDLVTSIDGKPMAINIKKWKP